MQVRKIIQKRLRGALAGTFEGDRNAAVAINVGEQNAVTTVSSARTTSNRDSDPEKEGETA